MPHPSQDEAHTGVWLRCQDRLAPLRYQRRTDP